MLILRAIEGIFFSGQLYWPCQHQPTMCEFQGNILVSLKAYQKYPNREFDKRIYAIEV